MAIFIGTFENKVDQKGRVSVPSQFRNALTGLSFPGIIAFPSHRVDAIEGCGIDFMEGLIDRVDKYALFSETQDALATTIFADSQQLSFDSTGRIVLPEGLREAAGITDKASFVGMGHMFRIWEPRRLAAHKTTARQRASQENLVVPPSDSPPGGGGR